jgi:hypothetical protein
MNNTSISFNLNELECLCDALALKLRVSYNDESQALMNKIRLVLDIADIVRLK